MITARVLLLSFLFSLTLPIHAVFSADDMVEVEDVLTLDEAQDLIRNLPTASDAVSGVVSTDVDQQYYDLHARQLQYRENVKELRASLDERRENFVKPQVEALEQYRDVVDKVYAAETQAYQDELALQGEQKDEDLEGMAENENDDEPVDVVPDMDVDSEEDTGLTEQEIPQQDGEDSSIKKKVVTSDDAPDFDPSGL